MVLVFVWLVGLPPLPSVLRTSKGLVSRVGGFIISPELPVPEFPLLLVVVVPVVPKSKSRKLISNYYKSLSESIKETVFANP